MSSKMHGEMLQHISARWNGPTPIPMVASRYAASFRHMTMTTRSIASVSTNQFFCLALRWVIWHQKPTTMSTALFGLLSKGRQSEGYPTSEAPRQCGETVRQFGTCIGCGVDFCGHCHDEVSYLSVAEIAAPARTRSVAVPCLIGRAGGRRACAVGGLSALPDHPKDPGPRLAPDDGPHLCAL